MAFKSFRFKIVVRILLMLLNIVLFTYLFVVKAYFISALALLVLCIIQIWELIHHVTKTNRKIISLIDAINYNDYTITFSEQDEDAGFKELNIVLNQVMDKFKKSQFEKEEKSKFLDLLLNNISVGIMVFDKDGNITLLNRAVKNLLSSNVLVNFNDIAEIDHNLAIKIKDDSLTEFTYERKTLNNSFLLAVNKHNFKQGGKQFSLVALQNISGELDKKELETWHNLIRVLTHEMINSLAPIISLANTSGLILSKMESNETTEDLKEAIHTIERRSHGIMKFVDSFRSLNKVQRVERTQFNISELFNDLHRLIKVKAEEQGIAFKKQIEPETLTLFADYNLIEQVLLNLLLNAIDAVTGTSNAGIELSAELDAKGKVIIRVSDNGPGIDPENADKIFIPFFTTKTSGNGIGLSLSKHIIGLHQGRIFVESKPGERTTFTISL